MICRKCKKETPDGAFCIRCGAKQSVTSSVKKRGNGQGCVYRTASGTWAAEITLGYYMQDGVKKRKMKRKCGFATKKEAALYISELRSEQEKPKVITLSELWERYSENWELSKSKQVAYRIAWRKVKAEVGWRTIDSFTVDELQLLVDTSAPSYYTRRDIKTVLAHLYSIAIRDDYENKNRASFVKLPKLVQAERAIFTAEEIALLWQDFDIKKEPITAHILTMLYTGIRPGELMSILTDNVHLSEHYMTGGIKTERGRKRKIVIPRKLEPVIELMISKASHGKIAYYFKDNVFYHAWIDKRTELGIREELTPYCCRHTFITNVTRLGVSPAMLQELAGHEDYDTTLNYTHLSIEDRLAELDRLE